VLYINNRPLFGRRINMPSLPQEVLIEKASKWQSRFIGNTASFNKEVTNEGVCLGLSVWRLYCTLTGKYEQYEQLLKLIYNSDPLAEDISPELHQAYETFIQNTLWLHRLLAVEAGTTQDRMEGALEALFKRKGEPFPLTYHQQFAGIITVDELKSTLATYLKIDPSQQHGVGFTLSGHGHSISITRVGNRIEVIDPADGKLWGIDLPENGTPETNAAALTSAINKMYDQVLHGALHFDEPKFQGTYHGIRMHVYSRLHNPSPEVLPTIYPSKTELVTAIYEKRKDTLDKQDGVTKLDALAYAVQNGDRELVQYLERTLGEAKLAACKERAFKSAVSSGQLEYVTRYYKKEYVDHTVLDNAFTSGNKQIIGFLLEKGHRLVKAGFNYALLNAARLDQGYTFNLLLEYYDKFHKEQPDLIDPAELNYSGKFHKIATPLLNIAAQNNSVEVMRMLLARNVNLTLTDELGRNCLHYLSLHQPELFIAIASRNPALLFVPDKKGARPIHRLYQEGDALSEKICPLLIKAGQWHEAYILALKTNNQRIINLVFQVEDLDSNLFFKTSTIASLPWEALAKKPELFELVAKKVDIKKLGKEELVEYYVLALHHKKMDLCKEISGHIIDKSDLLLKSPRSNTNPSVFFENDETTYNQLISPMDLDALKPVALNQAYKLALLHHNQDVYRKCIKKLKEDSAFLERTDDLDLCYQRKNNALFKELFSIKKVSEEWCKTAFIKSLHENNYEVASAILQKFPQLVDAQIDNINGVPQYPLWVAIHQENKARCQFLLTHNVDPYIKRLSSTLMLEAQRREPLKELFVSYDTHIKSMKNQCAEVLEQMHGYKKWKLTKKYGLFGDFTDAMLLPIRGKSVYIPKGVNDIVQNVLAIINAEPKISVLKEQVERLTKSIHAVPDTILPADLKLKLLNTLNPVEATSAHKESLQEMRRGADKQDGAAISAP